MGTLLMTPQERIDTFCRFMSFVTKEPGPTGCWIWGGNKIRGYGHFSIKLKTLKAHRWIYEFVTGEVIPTNLQMRHHCDNPSCVNPRHMEPGTAAQNSKDRVLRGRHKGARRGADHHGAKLNADKVREIRRLINLGETHQALAARFGVRRGQIGKIVNRQNWGHVA